MNDKERIVDYLMCKQVSTEEVGDILKKCGVVKGVYPVNPGIYLAGELQYVYAHSNSNWPVHEQLRHIEEGKIVFVDCLFVDDDHAVFGELVSNFILEQKKAKAIIVNGFMRDLIGLRKRGYPVWCKGITPIGCFNTQKNEDEEIVRMAQKGRQYYDGAVAVCDDSGVVVIPKNELQISFIDKLQFIQEQERIWFDCVENRGWDTYDTVCLKKYKESN